MVGENFIFTPECQHTITSKCIALISVMSLIFCTTEVPTDQSSCGLYPRCTIRLFTISLSSESLASNRLSGVEGDLHSRRIGSNFALGSSIS